MANVDLNSMTTDQLATLVKMANAVAKEKKLGIPVADADIIKLAGTIQNLATKMGIDVEKVIMAVGRNFKKPIAFRAYAPIDPNAPRKARKAKTK